MNLALDHVVYCVDDLQAAMADWTARGFTVFAGGEHANGTTRNALIVLDDGSYVELLAFTDRNSPRGLTSLGRRMWTRYHRRGPGLTEVSLLSRALDADLAALRAAGLDVEGPIEGARTRPDGQRVQFRCAVPLLAELPFLCSDVTPRVLRVPEAPRHANGVVGIARVAIAVEDLAASASRFRALLGQSIDETNESFSFALAGTRFLVSAASAQSSGEGPYRVDFNRVPTSGDNIS